MVVLLLLCEVFELAAEHPPHHVLLQAVYIVVLKLLHHLFDLAVGYQTHEGITVLHESHWVVGVVV